MNWFQKQLLPKQVKQIILQAESGDVIKAMFQIFGNNVTLINENTDQYIKSGYLGNADIYSIVRQISRSCSIPEWELFEIKNEKAHADYVRLKQDGSEASLFKAMKLKGEALEQVENPEIQKLFVQPNPLQGWTEFIELSTVFRLITGNRYWKGSAPEFGANAGKWQELFVLPAQHVEILPGDNILEPIRGYRFNFNPSVEFDADVVSHSKYPNPDFVAGTGSNFYGLSPLRPGRTVLTKSNDGYEASARLLQNSGVMGIVSGAKEATAQPGDMDIQAIKSKFEQKSRPENYGKLAWTNAMLNYIQMGMNANELGLNEGQMLSLRQACNIYNYPSELLNDKVSAKYNSFKEAKKSAIINAVLPELNLDRDSLNTWYLEPWRKADRKNYFLDYEVNSFPEMQEDLGKLWARIDTSTELTLNEKRKLKGFDERTEPGMDDIWLPFNLTPMQGFGNTDTTELDETLKALGITEYASNGVH